MQEKKGREICSPSTKNATCDKTYQMFLVTWQAVLRSPGGLVHNVTAVIISSSCHLWYLLFACLSSPIIRQSSLYLAAINSREYSN